MDGSRDCHNKRSQRAPNILCNHLYVGYKICYKWTYQWNRKKDHRTSDHRSRTEQVCSLWGTEKG